MAVYLRMGLGWVLKLIAWISSSVSHVCNEGESVKLYIYANHWLNLNDIRCIFDLKFNNITSSEIGRYIESMFDCGKKFYI